MYIRCDHPDHLAVRRSAQRGLHQQSCAV